MPNVTSPVTGEVFKDDPRYPDLRDFGPTSRVVTEVGNMYIGGNPGGLLRSWDSRRGYASFPFFVPVGPYTVEAWVKRFAAADSGDQQCILAMPWTATSNVVCLGYYGIAQSNWFAFHIDAAAAFKTAGVVNDAGNTRATHLAATWDGANLRLFVNGVKAGADVAVGSIAPGDAVSPVTVGGAPGGSGLANFNGLIRDLRVSNIARYVANFTPPKVSSLVKDANTLLLVANDP